MSQAAKTDGSQAGYQGDIMTRSCVAVQTEPSKLSLSIHIHRYTYRST